MRVAVIGLAACTLGGCGDVVIAYRDADGMVASDGGTATSQDESGTDAADGSADTAAEVRLPDYVAAGFFETIVVSFDDGRTWESVEAPQSPVEVTHEGIAASPDQLVIVGGSSTLVSADGRRFEAIGDQLGYARAVGYGGGTFVSVGLERRARSDDGFGWIDERQDVVDFDLSAVAYGNGRFVAVGTDFMMTSADGIAWEKTWIGGPKLGAIVFGDGRFVAAGAEGHIVVTEDGVNLLSDRVDGIETNAACFFDGEFALLSNGVVRVSEDTEEWREFAVPATGAMACGPTSVVAFSEGQLMRGDSLLTLANTTDVGTPLNQVRYTGR